MRVFELSLYNRIEIKQYIMKSRSKSQFKKRNLNLNFLVFECKSIINWKKKSKILKIFQRRRKSRKMDTATKVSRRMREQGDDDDSVQETFRRRRKVFGEEEEEESSA